MSGSALQVELEDVFQEQMQPDSAIGHSLLSGNLTNQKAK